MKEKEKAAWSGARRPENGGAPTRHLHFTPESSTSGIPIRVRGRIVGRVQDGVFRKRVRGSRHMLRKPKKAWALDVQSLEQAEALGAWLVELLDLESGLRYRAPISRIRLRGFRLDRGHGEQLALRLEEWDFEFVQLYIPVEEARR